MSLQRSPSDGLRSWYPSSSYAVHFKCVLSFGEPQQATDYTLDNAIWARSPSIQVKQSLAVIFERSTLYRTAALRRFAPSLRILVNNRPHSLRARTPPAAEKSTHFTFHASSGTSPGDDSMFL